MAKIIEPRTLSGFRDFLPETLRIRKKVMAIFSEIFEKYGFEPLETPALEYQDILLGKYGAEAEKIMYLFKDQGEREVGLRYDLTVPTSRVVAQYPNLPKPFKRYQIQSVWRAEKAQKGRYREFTQCDVDTFGTTSPLADAEIIALTQECLSALGFKRFTINLNSRQVLFKLLESAGIPKDLELTTLQSIDKLDKKSLEEVRNELLQKGLSSEKITKLFKLIETSTPDENLEAILFNLKKFGLPEENFRFNSFLVRGLDYYTGAIFESKVDEPKIGSITGGGRYDNLIGSFTGQSTPAVGTTLGLDRIVDVIQELNLWPDFAKQTSKVLVTVFGPESLPVSLAVTQQLRDKKINTEIYLDPHAKLDKQLKYADQKGISYAVIIGPDEAAKNLITVKNLKTKSQTTIPQASLLDEIKS